MCCAPSAEASGIRFDPIYKFLNRAAAAADWGLPEEGPVAALLAADCADWEPPRYCPISDVLKSAKAGGAAPWHNNVRPKWDPLVALFSVQVPRHPPLPFPRQILLLVTPMFDKERLLLPCAWLSQWTGTVVLSMLL